MEATTQWFQAEFGDVQRRLAAGFEAIETLFAHPETPPAMLREAFADIDFHLKRLLALLHFQKWHFETLVREGGLITTLAELEATPITRPSWHAALRALKEGIAAVEANPPSFENVIHEEGIELPHDMFVTGPDRVTEGSLEMDFDIPEASVMDQLRNEIALLVEDIWARRPQAS